MTISNDIKYIGVNDHEIDLFEGQFDVPLGMAYNSYLILDEKTAVMDSVESGFAEEWFANIRREADGRNIDYLIVQHMEPDHSSSIALFMSEFPNATLVTGAKAVPMLTQFFGTDYPDRRMVVKEGDVLELGTHALHFIAAPMVHWPEVIMTYDETDKVLFSADAFGKFGANDVEDPEGWACEARRYYFGIVGRYGAQAQAVLKKAADLDIRTICSLHGPVLTGDLTPYLEAYEAWTTYTPEDPGVTIAYTSVYGHTKEAVELLAGLLEEKGIKVSVHDLARMDLHEAIEDAFRYDRLVLATTTYNALLFPTMHNFIHELLDRGYKKRRIALIENGSWAPMAAKAMMMIIEGMKEIEMIEPTVTIKSALNEESRAQLLALAEALS